MPTNITCDSCGVILLGLRSAGPKPLGREECPKCGGTEFSYAE